MFRSNYRLLLLFILVTLNCSNVLSQINLRKGDHKCSSHLLKEKVLLEAVKTEDYHFVKRLLQQGANPNAQDDCNVPAVTYAVASLRPDILKELITAGAVVNTIDGFRHKPPLLWALESTEGEDKERVYGVAKLLVEAGADVNLRGASTQTALIMAVTGGLDEVAELLIAKCAKLDAEDDEERTAYSYAAQLGNKKLKNLLVSAGADINIGIKEYKRRFGKNAFIQAATDGRTDIVEAMLANGTDVNTANQAGVTALMRVVEDSTLDALLAAGGDVNKRDNVGYTALIWASFFGRASQVRKLIAAGADANVVTHDGKTALNMAKQEIKTTLIEAGAQR